MLKLLLTLCALTPLLAQQTPAPSVPATPAPPAAPAAGRPGAPPSSDPQPYEKVITKDAKSRPGLFTVHRVKDKYYYEIPKTELGKDFLWVTQIARTTNGVGHGGQALGSRVVRWDRRENRVFLREVNYDIVADPRTPIARAVSAANNNTIIMAFPVAANGPEQSAVVEVSRLFTTDVPEFSARQRLSATAMDASRSYIERISPYPENIEAEASHTYSKSAGPAGAAPAAGAGMRPGSATVVVHYSMVKLPEKPMMPRLSDERVGYFTARTTDFSVDEHRAPARRYITRWRLEKKNPAEALSEPVKPIIYYIDAATPTKWVPYLKAGVEKWQKAFEAAGFKNAIIAKSAPTPEEDPDFSPEDARYSVIRWLPSQVENASGPHIRDPRSGEILDSDIQFHHNIMNLLRDWYFLQVGPLDPRAAKIPFPDDLMGRLLEYVSAHEVGHTLGLMHNMKSSSLYPHEKLRDREFVKKMGHTPSMMDYSRYNYVAQPEDKIDPEDLIPGIGPYDVWSIRWGYTVIPNAETADQERPTLDRWAREQDGTPWLRFSSANAAGADPGELTEAVGDADAVKSTALGIKNLQRVAKMLIPATSAREGESYNDLAELYGRMLGQWALELSHVAAIVGGFDTQQKRVGQAGVVFTPVAKARQSEAVKFLNEQAFATPHWAIDPQILRRIEPVGALSRVRNAQDRVLTSLLGSARFARLVEQQAIDGAAAYSPVEFVADVRRGIWKELQAPQVVVDAYRRNLQRAYLDTVNLKLNGTAPAPPAALAAAFPAGFFASSGDERALYRAEMAALGSAISSAMARSADPMTRAHLEAARDRIAKMLDPKFAQSSSGAGSGARSFAGFSETAENCWLDYTILP